MINLPAWSRAAVDTQSFGYFGAFRPSRDQSRPITLPGP